MSRPKLRALAVRLSAAEIASGAKMRRQPMSAARALCGRDVAFAFGFSARRNAGRLFQNRNPLIVGRHILNDFEPVAQRVHQPRLDRYAPEQRLAVDTEEMRMPLLRIDFR